MVLFNNTLKKTVRDERQRINMGEQKENIPCTSTEEMFMQVVSKPSKYGLSAIEKFSFIPILYRLPRNMIGAQENFPDAKNEY